MTNGQRLVDPMIAFDQYPVPVHDGAVYIALLRQQAAGQTLDESPHLRPNEWIAKELALGQAKRVQVANQAVGVSNVTSTFFAMQDPCRRVGGPLSALQTKYFDISCVGAVTNRTFRTDLWLQTAPTPLPLNLLYSVLIIKLFFKPANVHSTSTRTSFVRVFFLL
ncbi:MAG: hypothetical protein NT075_34860 [Chloroflexi bacterium]|nr:hypothetical protein [Chloroflexota bacterium]